MSDVWRTGVDGAGLLAAVVCEAAEGAVCVGLEERKPPICIMSYYTGRGGASGKSYTYRDLQNEATRAVPPIESHVPGSGYPCVCLAYLNRHRHALFDSPLHLKSSLARSLHNQLVMNFGADLLAVPVEAFVELKRQ